MLEKLKSFLANNFPEVGLITEDYLPTLCLEKSEKVVTLCQGLKQELGFDILEDQTALDNKQEFILVCQLVRSQALGERITLKIKVSRTESRIKTLSTIFEVANWYEREIFDMFGIEFEEHPDLRRILLPEDWVGYPLRKDYEDSKMLSRVGVNK